MRRFFVGLEQIILTGRVAQIVRFENNVYGDGMLAEELFKSKNNITYVPEAYVLFNYLEPGRWNNVQV